MANITSSDLFMWSMMRDCAYIRGSHLQMVHRLELSPDAQTYLSTHEPWAMTLVPKRYCFQKPLLGEETARAETSEVKPDFFERCATLVSRKEAPSRVEWKESEEADSSMILLVLAAAVLLMCCGIGFRSRKLMYCFASASVACLLGVFMIEQSSSTTISEDVQISQIAKSILR